MRLIAAIVAIAMALMARAAPSAPPGSACSHAPEDLQKQLLLADSAADFFGLLPDNDDFISTSANLKSTLGRA
ncbi:hypothetical protein VD0002_g8632, partial [Verticillium dahliae]